MSATKNTAASDCCHNHGFCEAPAGAPEVITLDSSADEVNCDGGGGALGHPQVWYSFDGRDRVTCMYCDRLFIKDAGHGH